MNVKLPMNKEISQKFIKLLPNDQLGKEKPLRHRNPHGLKIDNAALDTEKWMYLRKPHRE